MLVQDFFLSGTKNGCSGGHTAITVCLMILSTGSSHYSKALPVFNCSLFSMIINIWLSIAEVKSKLGSFICFFLMQCLLSYRAGNYTK